MNWSFLQPTLHERVVRFFTALALTAIRQPWTTLLLAAGVTAAAAPGLLRLRLRTDGHALVAAGAPEVVYDRSIRERFGLEDQVVVLIRSGHTNGIFNPATLQRVRDLTAAFRQMPGLNPSNVLSLATEPGFRMRPGTLINETLLEPPLQTAAELARLREDLRRIELYTGTLVAFDGRSTAILIGTPAGANRTQLYQAVVDRIAAVGEGEDDVAVTGAPVAEALLGLHILEDLGVPKALLGASTRSHTEHVEWRLPRSLFELRRLIARGVGLLPVAILVMLGVFYLSFRRLGATLVPLPEVGATLVFVFGLMGWCGVPIYLTIAVMPVLLTAMCITDEIHVFSRYFTLLREQPRAPHVDLVRETAREMVCPVANTTLTTAIGFVSFAFSPLGPVQAFGIFTAVGVLFSLFYSLTVVPAMLVVLPPEWLVGQRGRAEIAVETRLGKWFARAALGVVRQRWWVVGAVLLVLALAPLGLRRLVVQDSWIDGFDPDSEFRRATQFVNDQFHGMHLLLVTADAPQTLHAELPAAAVSLGQVVLPGDFVDDLSLLPGSRFRLYPADATGANDPLQPVLATHIEMVSRLGTNILALIPRDAPAGAAAARSGRLRLELAVQSHLRPELIRALGDLAAFIRERRELAVGGVLGPAEYLLTTRFMSRPNDPNARLLPASPGEAKLLWDYYRVARGPHRLHQIVDTNFWHSVTTVFLKDANFIGTARLMADLRAYERERLAPQGVRLDFAGDVAVSQSLIHGIVTTQMESLFGALVGIYLVTALLGRSLRWGVYCVLPSALAVVINFAVMGWFGIPLGVATSMFAGMTLGIGVDFAIHVLEGHSEARARGLGPREALRRSLARTGPAVLINTLAISLGFGVLMLSQVPANARLGLLTVLGLGDCLIASLVLLPVLLHWWPLKGHAAAPASTYAPR